jgi:hypothetical protein
LSLLVLLDLQRISLFLVFVFLVLFVLVVYFKFSFYTQNPKNSLSLFAMGHGRFSYLPTKLTDAMGTSPNFKQLYGESLKDAWFRIKEINSKDPNPCKKEKSHLYFYYDVVPWYRNSLYFVSGGSFVLASPEETQ